MHPSQRPPGPKPYFRRPRRLLLIATAPLLILVIALGRHGRGKAAPAAAAVDTTGAAQRSAASAVPPTPPPEVSTQATEPKKPPARWQTYIIQPGDTLSALAARFGLSVATLEVANNLTDDSLLQIGQAVVVPAVDGVLHTIQSGDTIWDIARWHGVGVDKIVQANTDVDPGALPIGERLLVPGGQLAKRAVPVATRGGPASRPRVAPPAATAPAPTAPVPGPAASAPAGRRLRWPLRGLITSPFGWRTHPVTGQRDFHAGIDIGADTGTPVRAAAAGLAVRASPYGGWGLTVELDNGGGMVTRYSHASKLLVSEGDRVEAGQVIALVGSTGVSTGPHLDFGVSLDGSPVDPMDWLEGG